MSGQGDALTAAEQKRLLALMMAAAEVTNRELREQTGYELERAPRERLNELKLVQSRKQGQAFVHELTDLGWARCRAELAGPLPERIDANGKFIHALLGQLDRALSRSGLQLADLASPTPAAVTEVVDVDAQIRQAYGELKPGPGAWVRLARLRKHLEGVVQADELDAALIRLNNEPDISIFPDSDQRRLTAEDRAAAVRIGGEERHLLKVAES
jgi:hypothetical protein